MLGQHDGHVQLFLINILHQTATWQTLTNEMSSCSLSIFYIKPQLFSLLALLSPVIPYQYSTSNRNRSWFLSVLEKLFLINILHQTATLTLNVSLILKLFLINILHQTATRNDVSQHTWCCSLSIFYIKPQPVRRILQENECCSLSIFYIKPQRRSSCSFNGFVVPYQYSTSNRNR